ncbi:RNA-directed DNA polymerase, eukaryota, Reverse transcriptase zinc-binding domain protein [Artemisia annua]|uniref:RNA-directed DNA polymerase, eukaryota, Reverse transcriptase zinc-binding domain protein n=1 Tax=Artemisia annua TaxID=35608 RepID=A0A2U1KWY8_ARTAN|nr:RNA-directed DNA polymerase, eukaryota, Reverse transcriptase zinc-binding domain protein [Artemisia annua]
MVGFNNGNGSVCKKDVWASTTDIGHVIDNKGIHFRDSFQKGLYVGLAYLPRSRSPSELQDLSALLSGLCLLEGTDDGWRWLLNPGNSFSVKCISRLIDDATLGNIGNVRPMIGTLFLPKKINLFVWRLALNRLPLFTALADKGLDIPSILCPVCGDVPESLDHTFLCCPKANLIWSKCLSWWGIDASINDNML